MSFAEDRQTLLREFVLCVENQSVPPLSAYLPDYVKSGCTVAPDDFRLLPLTPPAVRFANTSSDCSTDCMLDLQSKYQQVVPDAWGGHLERGNRDIGVIGFNILEGVVLDILEINQTSSYIAWAEPKLNSLDWQRLLIHAVVDFGRSCQVKQVRLRPEYDRSAQASGFVFDQRLDCFVLDLGVR